MKRKKIIAIVIAIIFVISSIGLYYYITSIRPNESPSENENNNGNGNNIDYGFIPPTGVKREPSLDVTSGSNPSDQNPWPMFQHDLQHTSYISDSGNGNIDNYGLLYHRWQDAYSQPVIADFDNDDKYEILSYSEGDQDYQTGKWYFQGIKLHAFDGKILWTFKDYGSDIWASPAIADINNDGEMEIILPLRSSGAILALDRNGNKLWQYNVSNLIETSLAIADINFDGQMEIIFGTTESEGNPSLIYVLTIDGNTPKLLWTFQPDDIEGISSAILSSPSIIDLNKDGKFEIIFGCHNGNLYAVNNKGELFWKLLISSDLEDTIQEIIYASPTIADLDGDGSYEILIQLSISGNNKNMNYIFCISNMGKIIWKIPTWASGTSSASIGDLNNDGWLEIIIGTKSGDLYALKPNKTELWKINLGEAITGSPSIVDLDGDGSLEVITVSSSRISGITTSNITIFNKNGSQLWRYQIEGSSWTNIPVVDLNSDGKLELVMGVYESFPPGQNDLEHRLRSKTGLYVFGDLSSTDLIDTLPDVAIKDPMIEVNYEGPSKTIIKVTVANAGIVEATNVEVEVQTNLVTIGTGLIDSIPPLCQKQVEITWAGQASRYTAIIDPNDLISESDESNNEATKSAS